MADGASLPCLLLWSLPVMFALHDAEEVLFLPPWLRRNREFLARRFPRLARRMLPHFDGITPMKLAVMAVEELTLLVTVTLYAGLSGDCLPWLALYLAFGVHLLIHLAQWAAVRRYVPVVATSLFCLVCCGCGMYTIINSRLFTLREFVFAGMAGCAVAAVNLWFLHRLAAKSAAFSGRRDR